ncbi:MAG TPA: hypothetical protein VHB79_39440 [Polyangiaceae bacterium]|nr:hypothetical protein [Polyangiaceae bacterium]
MKLERLFATCGLVPLLLSSACTLTPVEQPEALGSAQQAIAKTESRKIYVHLMPWFETPGFHWDMVGRHYNPQIGPYHSGDYKVIEYQLLLMKYAGIDGVIIDWPGRSTMFNDLPANAENTDQIIDQTAKFGMEFAVCFEDQYAGDVNDAKNSMHWVRDHYFNKPNHIKINNAPALFVFGPQKIAAGDWAGVLAETGTDPSFFSLWYNMGAGPARDGTFAWLYSDGLMGVRNYYDRPDQGTKVPVLYPGFNAAYPNGAPGWSIPYDAEGDTFTATWNLAKGVGTALQIATWNDYTEGTMIEPSNELGYKYLVKLQQLLGVSYGQQELEIVRLLFDKRKANDPKAEAASQALIKLDVAGACAQLGCTAPVHDGSGGTGNNTAGTTSTTAGTSSMPMAGNGTGGSGNPTGGAGNASAGTANPTAGSGGDVTPLDDGSQDDSGSHEGRGCSVAAIGAPLPSTLGWLLGSVLLVAVRRRRSRLS